MRKREPIKKQDNVVFFPGFEKRLTDKGLESLHNRKYSEAIQWLEEARTHDPENGEILIGLVLAYFESSAFQKAKVLAKDMLLKGIGDYFQLVDLYLTILIQLHEYDEIVTTIEVLLEEKEIPPDRHNHFTTLLQFSRRMAEGSGADHEKTELEENNSEPLNLLTIHNLNEQMLVISNLAEKNFRPYIAEIESYLQAEEGHPFIKTVLVSLLKEQEWNKELIISKFLFEYKVNPTKLPDVRQQPKVRQIKACLEQQLENSNPGLLDPIIGLVDRIFFISYPFELEPEQPEAWAAAFQILTQEYLGEEQDLVIIADEYQVQLKEIELAIKQIKMIEKISYPNI
ncbi:tetratricopeptide repeat protein [Bacillus sp. BRMEA1]|uniref:tetratricopeptide repeat protein n=1 Tax=Neobacillus endophyticus TaxID=2738405 RepID=UPI001563522C|nr:tetratricopeptide repeat protein [Neobacillus endophyticus]NRD76035.1 tetratricopeptide repeat protein [Neobacillus endophyticus]